jgi:Uncharacterised nucleotidyltransferase
VAVGREASDGAHHRALLHALVGPVADRSEWWAKWQSSVDLDASKPAAFELLPLAYRRFGPAGGRDTDRLAGIYRYAWCRNRMFVRSARPVLERFDAAGIAHVILKGAALGETMYHDRGARPISDVDLLVQPHDRDRAIALLDQDGWFADSPVPQHTLRVHHALNVSAGPLAAVDLHWGILYLDRNPAADQRAWQRTVEIDLDGEPTRALCPTDQLLHAIVHASRRDLRWIVDTGLLIESGEVDWRLFVREVEARRVIGEARSALATAVDMGGVKPPAGLLEQLDALAMSAWDRLVQRTQRRPDNRSAMATRALDEFARRTRGLNPTARAKAVVPYLAQVSGKAPIHRSLSALTIRLVHPPLTECPL